MSAKLTISIPEWLDKICAWPVMPYRKHKYGYAYRRINLGEGEWTILDQEDYYRLNRFKWCAVSNDRKVYAARILRETKFGRIIDDVYAQGDYESDPKGLLVDHRNGDTIR